MENRKRNVQIIVRVTEEERALIEEKMRQIPTINLSAYSRKMLIDGYIIQLDMQDIKTHTAQLQKIGVNINQIAKRINETGQIYADDIDEAKRVMSTGTMFHTTTADTKAADKHDIRCANPLLFRTTTISCENVPLKCTPLIYEIPPQ